MFKYLCFLLLFSISGYASNRPNIIFFLTDDQRYDFLGCSGHPVVKTPHLDKLASEGTRFENTIVTTATCWISRVSILTGLHLRTHRFTGGTVQKKFSQTSYPAILKNNGYQTAYIGKTHFKLEKGEQQKMFDYFKRISRGPYFKKMPDGSLRHESELCGDEAIKYIRKAKGKPFFISVNFNATHAEDKDKKDHFPYPKAVASLYEGQKIPLPKLNDPSIYANNPDFLKNSMHQARFKWRWDTPEKYQHNMRNYLRMASGVDHVIGRVLSELKSQNLHNNTIIIYSADNGYYAGDRGFAGKWTHYEESLRVPLIIHDPRLGKKKESVRQEIALNIDIPATILDYAGCKIPPIYQGLSLKEIVEGQIPAKWRKDTLYEFFATIPSIPNVVAIRGERYVYARYTDHDFEFLHDLEKDPDQLVNYAKNPEYKDILENLRNQLETVSSSYGEKFTRSVSRKIRKNKK